MTRRFWKLLGIEDEPAFLAALAAHVGEGRDWERAGMNPPGPYVRDVPVSEAINTGAVVKQESSLGRDEVRVTPRLHEGGDDPRVETAHRALRLVETARITLNEALGRVRRADAALNARLEDFYLGRE